MTKELSLFDTLVSTTKQSSGETKVVSKEGSSLFDDLLKSVSSQTQSEVEQKVDSKALAIATKEQVVTTENKNTTPSIDTKSNEQTTENLTPKTKSQDNQQNTQIKFDTQTKAPITSEVDVETKNINPKTTEQSNKIEVETKNISQQNSNETKKVPTQDKEVNTKETTNNSLPSRTVSVLDKIQSTNVQNDNLVKEIATLNHPKKSAITNVAINTNDNTQTVEKNPIPTQIANDKIGIIDTALKNALPIQENISKISGGKVEVATLADNTTQQSEGTINTKEVASSNIKISDEIKPNQNNLTSNQNIVTKDTNLDISIKEDTLKHLGTTNTDNAKVNVSSMTNIEVIISSTIASNDMSTIDRMLKKDRLTQENISKISGGKVEVATLADNTTQQSEGTINTKEVASSNIKISDEIKPNQNNLTSNQNIVTKDTNLDISIKEDTLKHLGTTNTDNAKVNVSNVNNIEVLVVPTDKTDIKDVIVDKQTIIPSNLVQDSNKLSIATNVDVVQADEKLPNIDKNTLANQQIVKNIEDNKQNIKDKLPVDKVIIDGSVKVEVNQLETEQIKISTPKGTHSIISEIKTQEPSVLKDTITQKDLKNEPLASVKNEPQVIVSKESQKIVDNSLKESSQSIKQNIAPKEIVSQNKQEAANQMAKLAGGELGKEVLNNTDIDLKDLQDLTKKEAPKIVSNTDSKNSSLLDKLIEDSLKIAKQESVTSKVDTKIQQIIDDTQTKQNSLKTDFMQHSYKSAISQNVSLAAMQHIHTAKEAITNSKTLSGVQKSADMLGLNLQNIEQATSDNLEEGTSEQTNQRNVNINRVFLEKTLANKELNSLYSDKEFVSELKQTLQVDTKTNTQNSISKVVEININEAEVLTIQNRIIGARQNLSSMMSSVARAMYENYKPPQTAFKIVLNPASLGQIAILIRSQRADNSLSISMNMSNNATLESMVANQSELRNALSKTFDDKQSFDFEFKLDGDDSNNQRGNNSSFGDDKSQDNTQSFSTNDDTQQLEQVEQIEQNGTYF